MGDSKQNEPDVHVLKAGLLKLRACVEGAIASVEAGDSENGRALLEEGLVVIAPLRVSASVQRQRTESMPVPEGSRVIEGVFDGQHMVGADGKQYLVPPNYASKSKLVEGDMMKLSITPDGAFIYKQIGPIARRRIVGSLTLDEEGLWHGSDGVHEWRLLTAAVTYFKGKPGDEVVILVPSEAPSKWAAVENIIAK